MSRTRSVALVGTEGRLVDLEVHIGDGIPVFRIVGLPATSVREAEQRVTAALDGAGKKWRWPRKKILANLAPAGLRKDGTHFDLALALGVLAADGRLPAEAVTGWVFVGELAFDGSVRSIRGCLAAAMACIEGSCRGLICPAGNAREAAVIDGLEVVPVRTVQECIAFIEGRWRPDELPTEPAPPFPATDDMAEVRGQQEAKRALEVAAAGGHNLLLKGSPGSGKTMLASRLPGILPSMTAEEALEVTRIHSIAGMVGEGEGLARIRPFRSPHHSISIPGLVGGGNVLARPGEISLAHHGALFLDELGLYRADLLDTLRSPIEDGWVRIVRSGGAVTFPCRFSLIAAANPCPCGFRDDHMRTCRCSEARINAYDARMSGPIVDRFDIQVHMRRLTKSELLGDGDGESSATIRTRVEAAREVQRQRYGGRYTNATAPRSLLDEHTRLPSEAVKQLGLAIDVAGLSGRGVMRVKRVARTLADLAGNEAIDEEHVAQAMLMRLIDARSEAA